MPIVRGVLQDIQGAPIEGAVVKARLISTTRTTPVYAEGGEVKVRGAAVATDATGLFQLSLDSNEGLIPAGTYYEVTTQPGTKDEKIFTVSVPVGAGPFDVEDVLHDPPSALVTPALTAHKLTVKDHGDWADVVPAAGQVPIWDGTKYIPGDTVSTDIEAAALVTAHNADEAAHPAIAADITAEAATRAAADIALDAAIDATVEALADLDSELDAAIAASLPVSHTTPRSPSPATLTTTAIATGSENIVHKPMHVSKDGRVFGGVGRALLESTDEWATRTVIKDFAETDGGAITSVRSLDNGEMLVAMFHQPAAVPSPLPASLMLSSGFAANPATATWTKVLETSLGNSDIIDRCVSVAGPYVLVGEYGIPKGDAIHAWFSDDYGQTFSQVFDLTDYGGDPANAHVHGTAVDPWERRLYVLGGDGDNRGIFYASIDAPTEWTKLIDEQPTTGIATSSGVYFGTDESPHGILRATRGLVLETEQVYTRATGIVGSKVAWRGRPGDPVLFTFGQFETGTEGVLVATADGENFYPIYVAGRVIDFAVGPTNGGNLLGVTANADGTKTVWRAPAPSWAPSAATPATTDTQIWLPARRWGQGISATESTLAALWKVWQMSTGHSILATEFDFQDWATFNVDLYVVNGSATPGNWVWRLGKKVGTPTLDYTNTSFTTDSDVTQAAPAQNTRGAPIRLNSAPIDVPGAGNALALRIDRRATGDTIAGTANVLGVLLTKAS
jgi:hypothetical protein